MALPSFASRPEQAESEPVALTGTEYFAPAPSPLAGLIARVKAILSERSDSRIAQLVAGKVFLVRVGSAMLALVSKCCSRAGWASSSSASTSMFGPGC